MSSRTLQAAPTIIAFPLTTDPDGAGGVGIYDFFSKTFAVSPAMALQVLSLFSAPRALEEAQALLSGTQPEEIEQLVENLCELGFLVEPGSAAHNNHEDYRRTWEWDALVGAFHFSVLNHDFMSLEASVESQLSKLEHAPSPELSWRSADTASVQLPMLSSSPVAEHLGLLASRRTNRTSAGHVLSLREIGDCLFSAFGVCQYVQTPVGRLPLSTAPSGGARNPYEAYVLVRRCAELQPGVYHYAATTHQLEKVNDLDANLTISALLAGQEWSDSMAAIIFLVAVLERTMWKYQDANAYRVVLIEAGHRAQNVMTTATQYGLTVCPTAALAHARIQTLLKIENALLHVPVYALTLDKACPYPDPIYPNPYCGQLPLFGDARPNTVG